MTAGSQPETMPAWAVRLEAKVDVALAQHGARLDDLHETAKDHEARLRVQEAKRCVTTQGAWAAVLGASALVGTATTVLSRLTGNA